MSLGLFASLAALLIAALAIMSLVAKLANARADRDQAEQERDDLRDTLAERDVDLALTREMNGSLLAEVTEFRAKRGRSNANLKRGSAKIAANAKRKADAAKAH
jgi:septal ring factor EnvC (AmiA/AmiB activator)